MALSGLSQIRRFVNLLLLSFSFGGFLFYASVVVPIGSRVLDTTTQGFVTRQVTNVLNWATAATVCLLFWEALASKSSRSSTGRRGVMVCAIAIASGTAVLMWLHIRMDGLLNPTDFTVNDSEQFYTLHRAYLWVSTLQWLCSLPVLWILANDQLSVSEFNPR